MAVLTFRSYNILTVSDRVVSRCLSTCLHINLVTAENNRNVFTDTLEIAMPVGNILVGNSRSDVEHDDATLALDIVSIAETTELLLSSGIPHVEADGTVVGGEGQRVDLNTESRFIR